MSQKTKKNWKIKKKLKLKKMRLFFCYLILIISCLIICSIDLTNAKRTTTAAKINDVNNINNNNNNNNNINNNDNSTSKDPLIVISGDNLIKKVTLKRANDDNGLKFWFYLNCLILFVIYFI